MESSFDKNECNQLIDEQTLDNIQELLNICYCNIDIKYKIIKFSSNFKEFFEIDENTDLNFVGLLNMLQPENNNEIQTFFNIDILSGQNSFEKEFEVLTLKNNTKKWINALGKSIFDENGNIKEFFITFQDISNKKNNELEKDKLNERYELAIEGSNDGIWDLDLLTNDAFISNKYASMLGYEYNELPHTFDTWKDLIHPDDRTRIIKIFYDYIEGKTDHYSPIFRLKKKDGNYAWILSRGKVKYDENGKPKRIVGFNSDITNMVNTEQMLKKANRRMEIIAESARFGVWEFNIENGELDWDKWMFEIYDVDPKTFQHDFLDWKQRIHPDDLESAEMEFNNALKNKSTYDVVFRIIRKNGEVRYIKGNGSYINEEDGDKMIGINYDITKIIKAEEQIRINEEKLRLLLENQTDLVVKIDTNNCFLFVSKTYCKTFGKTEDELLGNRFMPMVHIDDKEATYEEMKKLYKPPYKCVVLQRALTVDGWRWFEWMDSAVLDGENKVKEIIGVGRDVTYRIKAEEQIRISEEKYRALYQNAPLAYQSLDINGEVIDINPAWCRIMGYEKEEVRGKWFGEFLAPEFVDHFKMNFPEFKKRGVIHDVQFKMKKKNGNFIYVAYEGCIGYTNDGKFKQTYCTFKDITQERKAKEELILAKESAEEHDKLKSAFLANMSHEIRTPMNGIIGFANLLEENNLTKSEKKEYLEIIQKSGQRMLSLINDLINISKIESNQMEVYKINVDITTQLRDVFKFFNREAKQKDLSLIKLFNENKRIILKTDSEKFYAIMANLIKNSIKYTEKGKIEFGYILKKDEIEFFVQDTGIGISKDRLLTIFERFIQVENVSMIGKEGAGLGLAITKAYVDMLGGKIDVKSESGKGSRFSFNLPIDKDTIIVDQ